LLTSEGYNVRVATDVEETLEVLEDFVPEVILR
jgi:DNA-binding response OmpR family regulator